MTPAERFAQKNADRRLSRGGVTGGPSRRQYLDARRLRSRYTPGGAFGNVPARFYNELVAGTLGTPRKPEPDEDLL